MSWLVGEVFASEYRYGHRHDAMDLNLVEAGRKRERKDAIKNKKKAIEQGHEKDGRVVRMCVKIRKMKKEQNMASKQYKNSRERGIETCIKIKNK